MGCAKGQFANHRLWADDKPPEESSLTGKCSFASSRSGKCHGTAKLFLLPKLNTLMSFFWLTRHRRSKTLSCFIFPIECPRNEVTPVAWVITSAIALDATIVPYFSNFHMSLQEQLSNCWKKHPVYKINMCTENLPCRWRFLQNRK